MDVINDFGLTGRMSCWRQALPMARKIATLEREARAGNPPIYVNEFRPVEV